MSTIWQENDIRKQVYAPLSVAITAFAPVSDIRKNLTPQLRRQADSCLLLIDLGGGQNRLGGSCLAQVYNRFGETTPDLDNPDLLRGFFQAVQLLNEAGMILAYHDRSDGGLFVTLCEMAFASRLGADIELAAGKGSIPAALFSEEPGAVIQVENKYKDSVMQTFYNAGLPEGHLAVIGGINDDKKINIAAGHSLVYSGDIIDLHRLWSSTTIAMQSLRDNPACAQEELHTLLDREDPGLSISIPFDMKTATKTPFIHTGARPRIAILREQGVNGQIEMAAAFDRAGFACVDVHMQDLHDGRTSINEFKGFAACGGFSYGDVLGAGGGWAKSILFHTRIRDDFQKFFERKDTFGLGVCNGCQMLARLRELIPGAAHWPDFIRNRSEQFEARLVMVEILPSPSVFTRGMQGARIPIVVAHGEGRTTFQPGQDPGEAGPFLRYTDNYGRPAHRYPANPNGSEDGLTGFTSMDGRFSILMPHPERVIFKKQLSWAPDDWQHEETPWMLFFRNAREWLD